jgi:acyl-CoA synthetase (AMP-forming)/AMP-acid ligase II
VAAQRKIPVIELTADESGPAGSYTLSVPFADAGVARPDPDDVALVLHTSGTTSRPKIVPLRQRNLAASARNIAATLALTPQDRCLVIMPLFHIHGLIGALLSSLHAGASVHCPPGFNALKFFAWLDQAEATWYTAVPTMHQTILARADRNADVIARRKLRFIRSSSASLPPAVMKQLEDTFGCPVIESYGMTEASHQMASNPLPPRPRKPGSVGIAAGPEVGIMDLDGKLLDRGEIGEIVIRGDNVTAGYANNPKANAEAFTNGWFRTGDQGVLDAEGYLSLTGRLKEIINRGGEKIAPREVDDVLMDHPAVAQVVTFGMPHDKLGEEVAAAVVLREGQNASEQDLRSFAATRLADFKVPKKIVFLAEIPKGATGKLQRIGLAQRLGLSA